MDKREQQALREVSMLLKYRMKEFAVTRDTVDDYLERDEITPELEAYLAAHVTHGEPGKEAQLLRALAHNTRLRGYLLQWEEVSTAWLIAAFAALPLLMWLFRMECPPWLLGILLFMVLVFIAVAFSLPFWRPRNGVMKRICQGAEPPMEKLKQMHEVQQTPLWQMVTRYGCGRWWLAYLVIVVLLSGCLVAFLITHRTDHDAYQATMAAITLGDGQAGTRYAVYKSDEACYVREYLDEDRQAETAEDVRAVFTLTYESHALMDAPNCYRRVCQIALTDRATGECVMRTEVFGDMPSTTRTTNEEYDGPWYGSYPEKEKIMKKLRDMIRRYEAGASSEAG